VRVLYLAAPAMFCIAFIFAMLGMGGSQLYIPLLFWAGMDFKAEAIPLGLLLNVATSSSAATTYVRNQMVNWRVALPFAATMLTMPAVGAFINAQLPTRPLIILFALFTATAAVLMLSGWRPRAKAALTRGDQIAIGVGGGGLLGFLVGLIGRGGGSFVVPLLYICGLEAKAAAATSSVIVTGSALCGFLSHLPRATLHWGPSITSVAAVVLGSQLGSRLMARKLKSRAVKTIFGCVLLAVAAALAVQVVAM
jgi:uncharacterized membrane protein YfcA